MSYRKRSAAWEDKKKTSLWSKVVGAAIVVAVVKIFWPDFIPFSVFEFWKFQGSFTGVLKSSWIIFAWGTGITLLSSLLTRNGRQVNKNAEAILVGGTAISVLAGLLEELMFRWLFFYSAVVGAKVSNFLFFGWAGFGITQWLYLHILGPIANALTLGYLAPILLNGLGWAIGSAILTSNGNFRNEHAYNGIFGWVNSWFFGMFMFYLLFKYGLFACILVHFLYDQLIFVIRYLDAATERALGWT